MLSSYCLALTVALLPTISGSAIARSSSPSTDRYIPGSLKDVVQGIEKDLTGALSVGPDGVLRSFRGDREVVDYRQLDPEQVALFGQQQIDVWKLSGREIPDSVLALVEGTIDGRLVTDEDLLLNPSERPNIGEKSPSTKSKRKTSKDIFVRQSGACAGAPCGNLPTCVALGCMACFFPNGPPDGVCLDPNPNLPP